MASKLSRNYRPVLKRIMRERLARAAAHLERQIVQTINLDGPGPSAPGSPPERDSGDLVDAIDHAVDGMQAAVGTRAGSGIDYAAGLEFGAENMDARPFVRPTVAAERREVRNILAGR
jgi:HK97 gp10 family phage protein